MPNITDVDAFTDPVDIPADGDPATSASLLQFAQDLANRTRYLKNRAIDGLTGTIAIPIIASTGTLSADFTQTDDGPNSGSSGSLIQTATGAIHSRMPVLGMPRFGTLRRMRVTLEGASGHGALPATQPRFRLFRQLKSLDGQSTMVIDLSDAAASVVAYEASHEITSSDVSIALTPAQLWSLTVDGEGGANYVNGMQVYWIEVDVDP